MQQAQQAAPSIPIENSSALKWQINKVFKGTLQGLNVVIDNHDDGEYIYSHGFFGKGSLSQRSKNNDDDLVMQNIVSNNNNTLQATFNFNESLILSLHEALFLSYAVGCLDIYTVHNQLLGTLQFFDLCCKYEGYEQFLSRYVAYHYLRARGYVVRCGLKYGSDFVLYRKGPGIDHAQYSVNVVSGNSSTGDFEKQMNLKDLHHFCRLNVNVAKQLLLCIVKVPMPEEQKSENSLTVINGLLGQCKVHLTCVTRFIPKRERE